MVPVVKWVPFLFFDVYDSSTPMPQNVCAADLRSICDDLESASDNL